MLPAGWVDRSCAIGSTNDARGLICSNRGGSPGRRLVETHGHIGKEYFGRQAARKGIALPSHRDGFERSGIVWPPKIADLVVT